MLVLSVLLCLIVLHTDGANILVCLPTPSYSHQIGTRNIWVELSLRGHQVTIITAEPLNDPKLVNLTELDTKFTYEIFKPVANFVEDDLNSWNLNRALTPLLLVVSEAVLSHPLTKDLFHTRKKKFDLVIAEFVFPEFLAFSRIHNCPTIIFSSMDVFIYIHDALGNPIHPVLYPEIGSPFYKSLTFSERLQSALFTWFSFNFFHYFIYADRDKIIREFFNTTITTRELLEDVDLLFLNVHPVIHNVRPVGPTTINIGDIDRVRYSQPLNKDLKEFLDSASEGFIYFSLGGNVKSKNLNINNINSIIQALGDVPYKVLWKFEDDHLSGKPGNVKLVKWSPQQEVLAHPNIKLFVTQGGLQSMEEGINNLVPFVVIPFFVDQYRNAKFIVDKGIGVCIKRIPFIKKEDLKAGMLEVIKNSRNAVKKLKELVLDTPTTGLERAIWWTEYALRNNGTQFLRNPAIDLPFYQYYLLDVISFFVIILIVTFFMVLFLFSRIASMFKSVSANK